jgi:GntR family transcriptional repressor for pyruvate dehydrogenase complex
MTNKGVIVAEAPGLEEIGALYEARCALEGEAAYFANKNMTPEVITRLEALVIQMEKESQSSFDLVLRNREFHLALYKASGWESACRIINQLIDQTLIFRSLRSTWWTADPGEFHEDHRRIIETLKAGAADVTKRLLIANVSRGYQQIQSFFAQPAGAGDKNQETKA